VRHWFKYQHFEENVAQGRAKLDRELHRAGIGAINQEKIAQKLHFQKLEDLLAAIGRGDVSEHQIALTIQEEMAPRAEEPLPPATPRRVTAQKAQSEIVLEGIGNLQTNTAKCCKPLPPDAIVGYLTRDHGVTIHRMSCAFIVRLQEDRRNRLLGAQWGNCQNVRTTIDIEIEANDRQGLLRDISDLFVREKVNATKANTMTRNNLALMQFSIEIADREQLSRLLALIQQLPSVTAARQRV
jgi:GTP pyrophosphokinase